MRKKSIGYITRFTLVEGSLSQLINQNQPMKTFCCLFLSHDRCPSPPLFPPPLFRSWAIVRERVSVMAMTQPTMRLMKNSYLCNHVCCEREREREGKSESCIQSNEFMSNLYFKGILFCTVRMYSV